MEGKIIHQDLSYKINGILFEVFKELGGGHKEKYYQSAIRIALERSGLKFQEQRCVPLTFKGQIVGKYFLDFLVEDKIVLELKRGKIIPRKNIEQVKQYLTALNLRLALIATFTYDGVKINRILNDY